MLYGPDARTKSSAKASLCVRVWVGMYVLDDGRVNVHHQH